jgi:hypothetical protein
MSAYFSENSFFLLRIILSIRIGQSFPQPDDFVALILFFNINRKHPVININCCPFYRTTIIFLLIALKINDRLHVFDKSGSFKLFQFSVYSSQWYSKFPVQLVGRVFFPGGKTKYLPRISISQKLKKLLSIVHV